MQGNAVLIYFSVCLSFAFSVPNDLGEVVFVNFLFRHGNRTPIELAPNDPYRNTSFWPVGWGELTDQGKMSNYKLGKWLRSRYKIFLPEKYKREDIYVRSTDVDRTLMSAYSTLAGLYEPDLSTNWNSDIKWTPIPVHTVPENLDPILAGKAPCPKYDAEMQKLLNSPEFQRINEKYKNLYDYLAKNTGKNVTSIDDVLALYDNLFIESLFNFTLPKWTKEVYPEPMKSIAGFSFSIPCYNPTLARLKMGLFFGELLQNMRKKITGKMDLDRKAWMYSAHDTTVANVLKSLNLFEPHLPPYSSLVFFELRKKSHDYFVAIYYRNSSSEPYFLRLEGCDKLCPFEKFEELISPLIPKNWEEECRVIRLQENIFDRAASVSFITIVSLALIFLFTLSLVLKFYKNQKMSDVDFAYRSLKMEVTS